MIPVTFSEFEQHALSAPSRPVFLFTPNYEPRSRLGVEHILNQMDDTLKKRTRFVGVTLQAIKNRVEPLEQLKQMNTNSLRDSLTGYPLDWKTVEYQDGEWERQVRNLIAESLSGTEQPLLLLDISCMPRRMVMAVAEAIQAAYDQHIDLTAYVMYSAPQRYPENRYAAEVGRLGAVKAGRALADVISDSTHVDAVVFLGRQGFDAKQLVDSLPRDKRVSAFLFMNRDNPLHSLEVDRANQAVLNDESVNVLIYLTVESAHQKLLHWAREVPDDQPGLYLMAPFGPKPLALSCAIALGTIGKRLRAPGIAQSDVVVLGGHQYNTPYSLGLRSVFMYKLNPQDFR